MGMTIRHVVLVSAVLATGAFVYVVGFSPIDEAGYRSGGRSSDGNGQAGRPASMRGMIGSIRQAMAGSQMEKADRLADELVHLYPQNPYALYYRATIDMEMGRNEAIVGSWAALDGMMESGDGMVGTLSENQRGYLIGWAKHGIGEYEVSRAIFTQLADRYAIGSSGVDSEIRNPGVLFTLACYRSMGGDLETAMERWEQAVANGYRDDGWWRVDPDLDALRDDPRFWLVVENKQGDGLGDGAEVQGDETRDSGG